MKANEPIQYLVGEAPFHKYDFLVNEHVLIPRADSEIIIEEAMNWNKNIDDNSFPERKVRLLDLGLGSGCLLLTLLKGFPPLSAPISPLLSFLFSKMIIFN